MNVPKKKGLKNIHVKIIIMYSLPEVCCYWHSSDWIFCELRVVNCTHVLVLVFVGSSSQVAFVYGG